MNTTGYWKRLWAAILGREVECVPADEQAAQWRARIAALEMDLAERDERIESMRREYAALQAAREQASVGAGQEQLEKLFKSLVGTLANLSVLTAAAEMGREVQVGDLVELFRGLEKGLARAGLEPIGTVGEETIFDVACHQRMSGGAVRAGIPVTVQVPGYRLGEKLLLKALVSAKHDAPRQEEDHGQSGD